LWAVKLDSIVVAGLAPAMLGGGIIMTETADMLIIGGGVMGASIAYQLAKQHGGRIMLLLISAQRCKFSDSVFCFYARPGG